MTENRDKVLEKLLEKRNAIDEKIKRIKSQQNEKARKARTKRLIEIGAIVESVMGRQLISEELPKLKIFLEELETKENSFSNTLKKEGH